MWKSKVRPRCCRLRPCSSSYVLAPVRADILKEIAKEDSGKAGVSTGDRSFTSRSAMAVFVSEALDLERTLLV